MLELLHEFMRVGAMFFGGMLGTSMGYIILQRKNHDLSELRTRIHQLETKCHFFRIRIEELEIAYRELTKNNDTKKEDNETD